MSFTYTQPWALTRDYVRFLVGDTASTNHIYEDEELDSLLSQWSGDARLAAAEAIDALATQIARGAIRYSVTGFMMDRTQIVAGLRLQAKQLREQAQGQPFEFESVIDHFIDSAGIDFSNYINTDPEPP